MKKIGLIGGIGPESTLDYYRRIIDAVRERSGGLSSPEIIIYSANLHEALEIMQADFFQKPFTAAPGTSDATFFDLEGCNHAVDHR